MPLQNRVTPFGEIVSSEARGTLMGNRGCLHDEHRALSRRRWTTRAWVTCLLSFKGRRRQLMRPGYYTELFFLNEATALAAGHRPCAECRREAFRRFVDGWTAGTGGAVRPWFLEGHGPPADFALDTAVTVLTPRPIIEALRAGYRADVHPTAAV